MHDVEVRRGYFPGSIGRVVELHARYYHAHWGFGPLFEAQSQGDSRSSLAATTNFATHSGWPLSRSKWRAPSRSMVRTPLIPARIFGGS